MTTTTRNKHSNHVLVITLNADQVRLARADGDTIDPTDPDFHDYTILCEADPADHSRDCGGWVGCDCKFTDEQWHTLNDEGSGPCPESPTGQHQACWLSHNMAWRPSEECWVDDCGDLHEVAYGFATTHKLGVGKHRVVVHFNEESVDFELADAGSRNL